MCCRCECRNFAVIGDNLPYLIYPIHSRTHVWENGLMSCYVQDINMTCCYRGKIVLGYTEAELRVRGTGYQFIHAADMLYCAENHVRSKTLLTVIKACICILFVALFLLL